MGLRFRKSITLCKGVKLNLGAKSASISVGGKGFHQSFSTTGRTTSSVGIPGTGVSYQKSFSLKKAFSGLFKEKGKDNKDNKKEEKVSSVAENKAAHEPAEADRARYEEYLAAVEELRSVHVNADEPVDWNLVTDKELKALAERVLKGDTDAYLEAVEAAEPLADLTEYGSSFEIGTDDPSYVEVEFDINADETVPVKELSLTKTGKLSEKEMTKTAYYSLVQDYVCSTSIRAARDIFALLPVEKVMIHAVDSVLDTATGKDKEVTVLSVMFERSTFDEVDFSRIDPSDMVESCTHFMNFKKTSGFEPVDRVRI